MSPTPAPVPLLRAALLVATCSLTAACNERPEIRYETEHLRVGTDFDAPLCRGDLEHMELVIATVEAELATSLDEKVDVYLWATEDWPPEQEWCRGMHDTSCFKGSAIYSSLVSLDHELVHAVAATVGWPAPIWREGAAVALQSERTQFGLTAPVDNLDLDVPELDYRTAGAFARWLLETHGPERFRELMRSKGDARKAFESVYDISVEAAQEAYFADSPYSYVPLIACEHPELEQIEGLRWSESIDLDCDAAGTYGGPYGMGTYRVVTIAERGHYAISTSAPSATISRCPDEDLESFPEASSSVYGDIPPLTREFPQRFVRALAGNEEPELLDLAPGRYELSIVFEDHEPHQAQLDVRAAEGPVPVSPESTR